MQTPDLKFAIIATDVAIFSLLEGELKVLLIPVHIPPFFLHSQGVPGGLIAPTETAEESVFRHIQQKTGLSVSYIEQCFTFSRIDRDPRGRVVSVAYVAVVSEELVHKTELKEGVTWVSVTRLPRLAYDHTVIVKKALETIRLKLWYSNLTEFLLPKKFTLRELQNTFDAILGVPSDKRNFRKKIASMDILKKVPGKKREGAHRPAELYAFK